MKKLGPTPSGKYVEMNDDMIKLRDGLTLGLGFVLVDCTLGRVYGGPPRKCWEKTKMYELKGEMVSTYHAHPASHEGDVIYHEWPDDAIKAAHAIDRSKMPKAPKAELAKPREGG